MSQIKDLFSRFLPDLFRGEAGAIIPDAEHFTGLASLLGTTQREVFVLGFTQGELGALWLRSSPEQRELLEMYLRFLGGDGEVAQAAEVGPDDLRLLIGLDEGLERLGDAGAQARQQGEEGALTIHAALALTITAVVDHVEATIGADPRNQGALRNLFGPTLRMREQPALRQAQQARTQKARKARIQSRIDKSDDRAAAARSRDRLRRILSESDDLPSLPPGPTRKGS